MMAITFRASKHVGRAGAHEGAGLVTRRNWRVVGQENIPGLIKKRYSVKEAGAGWGGQVQRLRGWTSAEEKGRR